jgi:hypothetical protein
MVGGLGEYSDIILRELAYLTLPSLSLPSERTTPPPTDDLRCSRVAGARWSGNLTEVWLVTCGGRRRVTLGVTLPTGHPSVDQRLCPAFAGRGGQPWRSP